MNQDLLSTAQVCGGSSECSYKKKKSKYEFTCFSITRSSIMYFNDSTSTPFVLTLLPQPRTLQRGILLLQSQCGKSNMFFSHLIDVALCFCYSRADCG